MPRGPKGAKRPADVIGTAVKVMKIAIGEIEEHIGEESDKDPAAITMGGKVSQARAKKISKERRSEIAREAARLRWRK